MIRPPGMPKTRAISTSPSSAALRPLSTFAQITGSTVKNVMTEGIRSRVTHRKTRIVKEATGMDLISARSGIHRIWIISDFTQNTARIVPAAKAHRKPAAILAMERKTA